MFHELGWIVTVVCCTSTVVAITLTPMLCSKLLKAKQVHVDENGNLIDDEAGKKSLYERTVVRVLDVVDDAYAKAVDAINRYPDVNGHNPAGDGRAAVEIASIRNTAVMVGSMKTFDDYFADTVTNVGLKGEQAETNLLTQTAIMDDLRNMRDSISGVNIDEELAEIMKFQHGYNAAAKFVTVWDSLIDTIINRLGV